MPFSYIVKQKNSGLNCRIPCHSNYIPRSRLRGQQEVQFIHLKNKFKGRRNVIYWLRGTWYAVCPKSSFNDIPRSKKVITPTSILVHKTCHPSILFLKRVASQKYNFQSCIQFSLHTAYCVASQKYNFWSCIQFSLPTAYCVVSQKII